MTPPKDEGPALPTPTPQDATNNIAIFHDHAAQRKAFTKLQAEAAFQGVELIALPDGRFIACRRGWCKLLRTVQDVARYLSKGWLA